MQGKVCLRVLWSLILSTQTSKLNRGISFSSEEDSPTGDCFCHQFPARFDNDAVDKITCTFQESSHVVPVKQCKIDTNGDGKYVDCTASFDKDWGTGEEKVETEGVMRMYLDRPRYITGLKIYSAANRDRYHAVSKLKVQYRVGHYNYKYLSKENSVKLLSGWDWMVEAHALNGVEIDTTDGTYGMRTIYLRFDPILTDVVKIYLFGNTECFINEVELYDDCK